MVVGQTGEFVDVVVIGGGPGGYSAAIRAAQLGRSVVLVEQRRIGGVCLNEGCIPSKALLSVSRLYRRIGAAATLGIDASPSLDLRRLRAWKDGVVQRLREGVGQLLSRYEIPIKSGTAHLASAHRVAIEAGAEFEFMDFGNAILATGSRARAPEDLAVLGERVISPEQALVLERLPDHITILGSGYVALEIATAYARLGTSVVVVADDERLLPELDPALGQVVARGLRGLGVELVLRARVRSVERVGVQIERRDGGIAAVESGPIVAAAIRAPNTHGLGLERAGVRTNANGFIEVDVCCRSSQHPIFAVGDVVQGPLVAQRAIAQGRVAAEVIAGQSSAYEPVALPLAYFTEPEVISIGMTEAAARAGGLATRSARFPFGASGRAATLADQQGLLQVVAEQDSGRVLGIHAAGPGVSELAGEATLAVELGATLDDLALTVHPHPTLSEAIPEAAWLALDAPLHIFRSG